MDLLQKAKNYAFLLLKFRPRSEKELIFRLKKKNFDSRSIKQVIVFLKKNGYIDSQAEYCPEEEVISRLIQERLKELEGIEPQKIKRRIYGYLLRRGFSSEAINDALEKI